MLIHRYMCKFRLAIDLFESVKVMAETTAFHRVNILVSIPVFERHGRNLFYHRSIYIHLKAIMFHDPQIRALYISLMAE